MEIAIAFAPSGAQDRIAREVLVEILNERLRVVRETLGATYGVGAHVSAGSIVIDGDLEPAYAEQAAKAVAVAISAVRDGDPELANDFARARSRALVRSLARPLGASGRAEALERIALDRATVDELDREPDRIRALDLASVQQLASRSLAPDRMIVAARGNRDPVHLALLALGATSSTIETLSRTAPAKPKTSVEPLRVAQQP